MSARDRTLGQRTAADPDLSVWVSANAGSGKTSVLTDRVARLLLSGTPPSKILCITFTKAAAAEMANRLHKELAGWAVADDARLKDELTRLAGATAAQGKAVLARARRLFAQVLDVPGGLRIQTIHAFCEALLKRFPLEAGVSPGFAVLDDRGQQELLAEARGDLLDAAANDAELARALSAIVDTVDEGGFDKLLRAVANDRRKFAAAHDAHGSLDATIAALHRALGAVEGETPDMLDTAFVTGIDDAAMKHAATALARGSDTDAKRGAAILAWLKVADRFSLLGDWISIFLTTTGTPRKSMATKAAATAAPDALKALQDEQARIVDHVGRRCAAAVAVQSAALLRVADFLLQRYEASKRRGALLDFDDLIEHTARLLAQGAMAAWVLFKLDGGIDHVLVDEAQDTNQRQWAIVEALAQEFFAGTGARDTLRTIFAVGDEKQSIYSFQGADPRIFGAMHDRFSKRVTEAERTFRKVEIVESFRSTSAVLQVVDAVFREGGPARQGVAAVDAKVDHKAFRAAAPGLVELWPLVEVEKGETERAWDAPLDQKGEGSADAILAESIARQIRTWLDEGEMLASQNRPIVPGDIMILVRRRNALFEEIVGALKRHAVPVAGADRMSLLNQIAVQDLLVLGDFMLLPRDELALATVLKGPLYGFTDDDLIELCPNRKTHLWRALLDRANEQPHWHDAVEELRALLGHADFVPPFEFFADLLGARGGRRRMLTRLGVEAADPLDEFLNLAMAYQRDHAASLQGFLHWLRRTEAEVKRDLEQGRGEVRVLTTHGAKGLEAKVVILPDTIGKPGPSHDPLILWSEVDGAALPLWPARAVNDEVLCDAARSFARAAQMDEYRRLLYVALTRAEDRLYIMGKAARPQDFKDSWYELVSDAMQPIARRVDAPDGAIALRVGDDPPPPSGALLPFDSAPLALPAWTANPPPAEPQPARPLAPSRTGDEPPVRSPLGQDDGARFRRGRIVHRLLQLLPDLPPARRAAAAVHFLSSPVHRLDAKQQQALAAEVLAVLDHPSFAAVFAPGSKAEAPVAGRIGDTVISGQIDRLAVTPDSVLVVDYKTNRPPPLKVAAVDPVYLRQMALYRAALRAVFPGKSIRCALLWTDGPRLMPIPDSHLDAALV